YPDTGVGVTGGAVGAGGARADRAAVLLERIAGARQGLVAHLDADQSATQPPGASLLERLAPDELAFGGFDDPAEPRLERIRGLVDVVAVEGVLHLEPQRVAGAEPDGRGAVGAPGGQERLPELHSAVPRRTELEAVPAGIASPRDHGRHLRDVAASEARV